MAGFAPLALRLGLLVAASLTAPAAGDPVPAAALKPRGIWFWSKPASPDGTVNIIGRPEREDEALALFRRWAIGRVYGSYADLPRTSPAALAGWNRRLHAAGVRSESLFADGTWLAPANREKFLAAVTQRVLQFNAARANASERFDGVALDLEPHALSAWKTATPERRRVLLEDYLATCAALRAHLDAHGGRNLPISAALAFWYHRLPPEGKVAWKNAADCDAWFDRLATAVASVSLMAYERSQATRIAESTEWERAHFRGRAIIALRARLGIEWQSLADLQAVIPAVEALQSTGIDIENYELLKKAEGAAAAR